MALAQSTEIIAPPGTGIAPKRGPKTPEGRNAVAKNAIRHGIYSRVAVIEGAERSEDWEAHRGSVMAALRPVDGLEEALAERVVFGLWRLGRVARHERDLVAERQESVEARVFNQLGQSGGWHYGAISETAPVDMQGLREQKELAQAVASLFGRLTGLPDDATVDADDAFTLVLYAARLYGLQDDPRISAIYEGDDDEPSRTAGETRAYLARLVGAGHPACIEDLMLFVEVGLQEEIKRLAKVEAECEREIERNRGAVLLPRKDDLDRISRYESNVHRTMMRDLHTLERLQAARAGQAVPVPAAVDVTLCCPTGEANTSPSGP